MQVMVGNNYGSYTFNASTGVITFSGLPTTLAAGQVKLIVNALTNTIIFNLADPTMTGVVSGNTLDLIYNTSSMNNSDPLQIFMEVPDEKATQGQTTPVPVMTIIGGQTNDVTPQYQELPLSSGGSSVITSAKLQDGTGNPINSLSAGTGANGILTAQGATNFTFSSLNTTTSQLGASATFTGTIESVISAPFISIILVCDQPGLLTVNQYITSSPSTLCQTVTFPTNIAGFARSLAVNGNYINIVFQNIGSGTTTTLNLNTAYGNIPPTTQLLNSPMSLNEINGTALTGGSIPVSFNQNNDMFGDLVAGPRWSQFEVNFSGASDVTLITPTITGIGTATYGNGGVTIATATSATSGVNLTSTVIFEYRVGHEWFCYMTSSFTIGATNSHQRVGIFNGSPNSPQDGFFIGYEGGVWGLSQFKGGVGQGSFVSNSAPSIAQSAMNGDPLNGSYTSSFTSNGVPVAWNPQLDNLYRIRGGWLGTGVVILEVLCPDGLWITMHTYRFPNNLTQSYTNTTTWNYQAEILNGTNSSNIVMYLGGASFGTTDPTYKMTDPINNNTLAQTVRSASFGQYNNTAPTLVSGNYSPLQVDINSNLKIATLDNTVLYNGTISTVGAGASLLTTGYSQISFQLAGAGLTQHFVESSNDGVNWTRQQPQDVSSGIVWDYIPSIGIFTVAPGGIYIRLNTFNVDAGTNSIIIVGKVGPQEITPLLAQALDASSSVQLQTNVTNFKQDINNALIPSDSKQFGSYIPIIAPIVIDTMGYQSIEITTQGFAGGITASNDLVTWAVLTGQSLASLTTATTTLVANTSYIFPAMARYIRLTATTAGSLTGFLRQQPYFSQLLTLNANQSVNMAQVAGTNIVTAGVAGMVAVGGNQAAGIAPTANPVLSGGIDTTGLTRRILTDTTGKLINAAIDPNNTYRALGVTTPSASSNFIPMLAVSDQTISDGQTFTDLLSQILLELRLVTYYLHATPSYLTMGKPFTETDEPAALRQDPTTFNL